ncbi:MAG TPA: ParA family protein [Planctomycetota bacterium]
MQVVAVINQKGGVGKTTSCVNLGAAVAMEGRRTLLIDLDPQAHLSISFDAMPEPGEPSVYTMLAGEHAAAEVRRETGVAGLTILPTNLDLTGAETEFSSEIGRETLLRNALEKFAGSEAAPELVLLDCPPSLGLLSLNAMVAAQHVLVPVQAEFFALQGMAQLLDVVQRVQRRINPQLELVGILVGMFAKQRNLSREVLEELRAHFDDQLFRTLVRVNVRLAEAPSHAKTIFEYAPESGAAQDFRAVARELMRRVGLPSAASQPPQQPPEPAIAAKDEPATPAGAPPAIAEPALREREAG